MSQYIVPNLCQFKEEIYLPAFENITTKKDNATQQREEGIVTLTASVTLHAQ